MGCSHLDQLYRHVVQVVWNNFTCSLQTDIAVSAAVPFTGFVFSERCSNIVLCCAVLTKQLSTISLTEVSTDGSATTIRTYISQSDT